ncbi:hypothetical protein COO60DRAFT_1697722 [Scenedesmus sp. NREL 46B-D3]|nr:hypothetical protein COO60DRAFT_1697722 [Scenedesmus sp. NREL 46B-D3]
MLLSSFRSLVGQGPAGAVALTCLGGLRSYASESHRGAGRFQCVWEKVLLSARSSPEKLHDVVGVLSMHCITTQTAPPLDPFNELLRLCDAHGDIASAHKLTQMAMAVSMHLDEHTFMRMQSLFQYFPRPFPESAPTASSSSSHAAPNSSTGSSSPSVAPAAHGARRRSSSSSGGSSSSGDGYTSHSSTSYPGGVSNSSTSSSSSVSTGLKGVWVPLSSPGPQTSAGMAGTAPAARGAPDAAAHTQGSSSSSSSSGSGSSSSGSGSSSGSEGRAGRAPSLGRYGSSSGVHGRMRD